MKKFYICLAALIAAASPMQAQEANYDHPTALRYLATISNTRQQPVCNLTTRNPINNGAFLEMGNIRRGTPRPRLAGCLHPV